MLQGLSECLISDVKVHHAQCGVLSVCMFLRENERGNEMVRERELLDKQDECVASIENAVEVI